MSRSFRAVRGASSRPERVREDVMDQLKDCFVHDGIGREEFERRVGAALSESDDRRLEGLVSDLPVQRRRRRLPVKNIVVAAVGVVCLGAVAVQANQPPEVCASTGLSSDQITCPALTTQQQQIEDYITVATTAAHQARQLAGVWPWSDAATAAQQAEDAAQRTQQYRTDAQTIVAGHLGQQLPDDVFDSPLAGARAGARAAVQSLHDAQTGNRP